MTDLADLVSEKFFADEIVEIRKCLDKRLPEDADKAGVLDVVLEYVWEAKSQGKKKTIFDSIVKNDKNTIATYDRLRKSVKEVREILEDLQNDTYRSLLLTLEWSDLSQEQISIVLKALFRLAEKNLKNEKEFVNSRKGQNGGQIIKTID